MCRVLLFTLVFSASFTAIADAQYRSRYSRSSYGQRDDDKKDDRKDDDARSRYERYKKSEGKSESKSYRFLSAHERLPSGVPAWFIEKDKDFDGQVKMAEYATDWSEAVVDEYRKYDKNFDGFITPDECMEARGEGLVYESKSGGSSSSSSDSRTSRYSSYGSRNSSTSKPEESKEEADAEERADTRVAEKTEPKEEEAKEEETADSGDSSGPSKAYVSYAVKVIAKYDTNRDGVLVAKEWGVMSKDPSSADTSGDGRITPNEYAVFLMPKK